MEELQVVYDQVYEATKKRGVAQIGRYRMKE